MTRWLRSLGSRCAARPLVVVGSWLLVAAVVTVVSMTLGGDYTHSSTLPGTQVQSAEELLARHLPSASHETADVVVQGSGPDGAREATAGVVAAVVRLPHVVPSPPLVRWSADGTTSLVRVEYDTGRYDLGHSALAALRRAVRSVPDARVYVGGSLARDAATPSGGLGEEVGIAAAVVVLLVVFGSVIAALMPIATAAVAIITGLGLVKLLAGVYSFNDTAPQLATMMGLGVGVDYALFIVTRHREGLRDGMPPPVAASVSTATSGSSVLCLAVLAIPIGGMRLGAPDAGSAPHNSADYKAFTAISRGFGVGANADMTVVLQLPRGVDTAAVETSLRPRIAADRDVASVS